MRKGVFIASIAVFLICLNILFGLFPIESYADPVDINRENSDVKVKAYQGVSIEPEAQGRITENQVREILKERKKNEKITILSVGE